MFITEGVVCACLLHVLSCTQLCCQMERMQGEGEMDHLEQPSPLTDKERVMIQDSWAKVYQNCDDAGVAILVRYLFLLLLYSVLGRFQCNLCKESGHIQSDSRGERACLLRSTQTCEWN